MLKFLFPPNGRLLQTCIFSGIISFLNLFFQYYVAFYPNTAAGNIQKYINDSYLARGQKISANYLLWFWNSILNLPFIGFLLSNLLAPYLCERAGRRGWGFFYFEWIYLSAFHSTQYSNSLDRILNRTILECIQSDAPTFPPSDTMLCYFY